MKYLLLICILFISCKSVINRKIRKGTIIVAGCCSDGIVIAADSREVSINSKDHSVIGFYDSCQKIFIVKNTVIANTGIYTLDSLEFYQFVNMFNIKAKFKDTSFIKVHEYFLRALASFFPISKNAYLTNNSFVSGGFINDTAYVTVGHFKNSTDLIIQPYYSLISTNDELYPIIKKYLKDDTDLTHVCCNKLQCVIEKSIADFEKTNPNIGGPTSIIRINKDNSYTWVKNNFSDNPMGETQIHYFTKKDTALINQIIMEQKW